MSGPEVGAIAGDGAAGGPGAAGPGGGELPELSTAALAAGGTIFSGGMFLLWDWRRRRQQKTGSRTPDA